MNAQTEIDSLPVMSLSDRYGIGRTALYDRLNALRIEPEKRGKKSYVNSIQLHELDELDKHLKAGGSLPDASGEQFSEQNDLAIVNNPTAAMLTLAEMIASRIPHQSDPLAHIRSLQEACDQKWKLSTSELCVLLKRQSIEGREVRKHGFICVRDGKNGNESAWKINRE